MMLAWGGEGFREEIGMLWGTESGRHLEVFT
jgi:hypothetical protein